MPDNSYRLNYLIAKIMMEKQNVMGIWKVQRRAMSLEQNTAQKFLKTFCPTLNLPILYQNQTCKTKLTEFLNVLSKAQNKQMTEKEYEDLIEKLKKDLSFASKIESFPAKQSKEKAFDNKNSKSIDGQDITVQIILNSLRMHPDYQYKDFRLKTWISNFVMSQLKGETIKIVSSTNRVRILEGKQQFKDDYTGTYVFDPFFNSVKIVIVKKKGSFDSSFTVVNTNKIKFSYVIDQKEENWIDESKFQLYDHVDKLIEYICTKEKASSFEENKIKESMKDHGYRNIKDLMYNTKQSVQKVISERKWCNELISEVEKIRSPTHKSFTGTLSSQIVNKQDKQFCYREGNSHKILRYVFYKAGIMKDMNASQLDKIGKNIFQSDISLKNLNQNIPKINPQLMERVISIVQSELRMQDLFKELRKYFKYFTKIPKASQAPKFKAPFGVLFYGPPGTGKTRLTEDLADLMGFHLVSHGISSAQFMKELVGQAKGTVHSYLKRPSVSRHLICSLAIDQIDAIVADRRKQNSKSQETIAMFLSGLGGNQAVENILVFASTNFRNLIDEAILRRLTPDFYVRIPSKADRRNIILTQLPSLSGNEATVDFLSEITPNYSGAAMKLVCQMYTMYSQNKEVSRKDLIHIAKSVGINYKIKFGDETYPQLYDRTNKCLSLSFIKNSYSQKLFVNKLKNNQFMLFYARTLNKWEGEKLLPFYQIKSTIFKLPDITNLDFQLFFKWVKNSQKTIQPISCSSLEDASKQIKKQGESLIQNLFVVNASRNSKTLFKKDVFGDYLQKNVNIIYYLQDAWLTEQDIRQNCPNFQPPFKKYTGRVVIDLTNQNDSKMVYQIQKTNAYPVQIENRPFFAKGKVKSAADALPEIVQFLMAEDMQYIQMINSQLLHDNNAFTDSDIFTLLTAKVDQAKFYEKSSIIVHLNSLISINKSISETETGQNLSKNINQGTLYHKMVQLMNNFTNVQDSRRRWIFIIVEDSDLLNMVKRDIKWANTAQQQEQIHQNQLNKQKAKRSKEPRICLACKKIYTMEENAKQKACVQHYGLFVDQQNCVLMKQQTTLNQVRHLERILNVGVTDDKSKHKFFYSCCWKEMDSQGCTEFQHWGGHQGGQQNIEQHVTKLRAEVFKTGLWQKQCAKFKEAVFRYVTS